MFIRAAWLKEAVRDDLLAMVPTGCAVSKLIIKDDYAHRAGGRKRNTQGRFCFQLTQVDSSTFRGFVAALHVSGKETGFS
jgi:hypothetical protein